MHSMDTNYPTLAAPHSAPHPFPQGHAYAGSKTTLRLQNTAYCGFNEKKGETCIHYSRFLNPKSRQCPDWRGCKKGQLTQV